MIPLGILGAATPRQSGGGGGGGDPYWDDVVALLHLDSTNGQTVVTDEKGLLDWAFTGNASISTESAKFGPSSAKFNNGALWVNGGAELPAGHPAYIASGEDFTIEGWIKPDAGASWSGDHDIFILSGNYIGLGINADGANYKLRWWQSGLTADMPITLGEWHHVAAVRHNGVINIYLDGIKSAKSLVSSISYNRLCIGRAANGTERYYGFIDEVRLTRAARYTSNFTPPSSPFPNGP